MGIEEITGGEVVIKALARNGIKHIFGIPGGANLPMYDELRQYEKDGRIIHFLMGQEGGAGHAAQGYARASGKLGVLFVTSGPGATNAMTAMADAKMDSTPILVVSGQVPRKFIGKDAFQETAVLSATMSLTKHNYLVKDPKELAQIMQEAMHLATTGRPGPILVDLPKDVAAGKQVPEWASKVEDLKHYQKRLKPNFERLEEAVSAIEKAERPIIYGGGGIITADASEELMQFAEEMNIPVTTTFMGLDSFPGNHRLALGAPGMHGSVAANYALNNADVVITLGARFDDRITGKEDEFAPKAKIIHVDIDDAEINKNKMANIGILGDAKDALEHMLKLSKREKNNEEWHKLISWWKKDWPFQYEEAPPGLIAPQYVMEELNKLKDANTIITTGVGQHQMFATQYLKYSKPRTFISSLGLATMGFGLPAAIGAQVAKPDSLVIDVDGDGSFNMNIQELKVAARYDLPVKVVLLDNRFLGMVDQWQRRIHHGNFSHVDTGYEKDGRKLPEFVKIADGYGVAGRRVSKPEEVPEALQEMIDHKGPFVLHVDTYREAEVYPMVGPGKAWHEMVYPFKDLPPRPNFS